MARLDRLHRRELSGGKGKERTRIGLQSGHGNPFSEVATLSIAQARCAKNAEDDLEDTQIKLGPIPVGPEQTLKNRRP